MYKIIVSDNALNQISKLPKDLQQRIFNSLERIKIRPYSYVSKLVGEEAYKLRVGDYRLIIEIEDDKLIILVIKAGHRKNIYKDI